MHVSLMDRVLGFRFFAQVQLNLGFSQKLMYRLAVHNLPPSDNT